MADRQERQGKDLGGHGGAVSSGAAPESQRWVEQRTSYDCLTACLASIFGVPYERAPQLWDAEKGAPVFGWHRVMDDWLAARGFACLERVLEHGQPVGSQRSPWRYPGYWVGGVKSPRYDGGHAVVMHFDKLVWDPHPQRDMGHLGFEDATYFLPLDPARLVLGHAPWALLDVRCGTTGDAERRLPESASNAKSGGRSDG